MRYKVDQRVLCSYHPGDTRKPEWGVVVFKKRNSLSYLVSFPQLGNAGHNGEGGQGTGNKWYVTNEDIIHSKPLEPEVDKEYEDLLI